MDIFGDNRFQELANKMGRMESMLQEIKENTRPINTMDPFERGEMAVLMAEISSAEKDIRGAHEQLEKVELRELEKFEQSNKGDNFKPYDLFGSYILNVNEAMLKYQRLNKNLELAKELHLEAVNGKKSIKEVRSSFSQRREREAFFIKRDDPELKKMGVELEKYYADQWRGTEWKKRLEFLREIQEK